MKIKSWFAAALLPLTAIGVLAAFTPGGAAYTKRAETALLAEPQMLAPTVARVGYASKLKVETVKGSWVRVSEGKNAGWVFAGNLAEAKPSETAGLDGLPVAASETSATAAARPLVPAAEAYSARHDLAKAADDLKWLAAEKAAMAPDAWQAYFQEQKKGEYQ